MSDAPVAEAAPAPVPEKPRRRFFPRFTLRTLTLCVLLAASGLGVWWKWEPWVVQWSSGENLARGTLKGFSPEGNAILTTYYANPSVWDARDGKKRFDIEAAALNIGWTDFSSDGAYIIRAQALFNDFIAWDIRNGKETRLERVGDERRVLGLAHNLVIQESIKREYDPNDLAAYVRCVDLQTQKEVFKREGIRFCLERNGRALAVLTEQRVIEIYRLPDCERIAQVGPVGANEDMLLFDLGALRILLRNSMDVMRVLNIPDGSVLATISAGRLESLSALSPDATLLYVQSYDQAKVNFYHTQNGNLLWSTDDSQTRYHRCSFSPDSRCVAVTEFEGDTNNPEWTRIFESRTGSVVAELAPEDGYYVNAIYSPTEMRILAEEADGTLTMWERRRPEQWWGAAWLPEFWLTVLFALLLLWSLIRDFKTLRKASTAP